ncbi:cytochrome c oxidase assembly protein [Acidipropionibacterium timonense]|uniref:cytochrome c oxidase assembly protein n=1 Tax=Acidipropionibacterium timonense TaxID=2161818 RepID=UPI00398C5669
MDTASARPTAAPHLDRRTVTLGSAAAVVMAVCTGVIASARPLEPRLLGRENPDPATSIAHGVTATIAWTFLAATLALLLLATILGPRRDMRDRTRTAGRPAWINSQIWTLAALVMVPLEAADSAGLPVGQVVGDLPTYLTSTPSVTAWLVMAALGLVVSLVSLTATSAGGLLLTSGLVVAAGIPVIVNGSISVGLDHDFSTDSGLIAGVALVVAAGSALAMVLGDRLLFEACARRTRWPLRISTALLVAGQVVVTWQGLAGASPFASRWGIGRVVLLAAGTLWFSLTLVHERRLTVRLQVALAAVCLLITGASTQLIPPRYLVPQTPQVNYLGYEFPGAPTVARLMLPGRPNILFLTLAVGGIVGYVLATVALRRRGQAWPGARTGAWIAGWVVVAYLAVAGLWEYSSMMFSWHMLVHMTFNMLVPALLVLGSPMTLLRQVLRNDGPLLGAGNTVDSLLRWRPTKTLFGPFAGWVVFVASFYVTYFTPVFGVLMRYHWGHQWMLLHFLFAGTMLFEYVIGLDELPASLPHIGRLGFVITAMPFHSFFAVITMGAHDIIGENYYRTLSVPWVHDLAHDQNLGGQITWATGEVPMALVLVALCVQWFLSDRRDQRRLDRSQDSGLDESLAAYNEMLARMAGQSPADAPVTPADVATPPPTSRDPDTDGPTTPEEDPR